MLYTYLIIYHWLSGFHIISFASFHILRYSHQQLIEILEDTKPADRFLFLCDIHNERREYSSVCSLYSLEKNERTVCQIQWYDGQRE